MRAAVKSRMIADVPLGAFLSGGIDSSSVVAMMQQNSPAPVKTFSIGFDVPGYNEAGYARDVARHLGTEHHELIMTERDALDVIPKLPDMYDEPFADASQIPTYLVAKMAREHVTVALSGDGGDEMLGGYLRYTVAPDMWKRISWMPPAMRAALAQAMTVVPPVTLNRMVPFYPRFGDKVHKFAEFMEQRSANDIYERLVGNWHEPEKIVIGGSQPSVPLGSAEWQARGLDMTEGFMYADLLSYLPNDILVKVDRATMAVALEARAPLLDISVFEYGWSLPMHMKIRNGKGKWVLRELLARHMPRSLFERPKQGFGMPVGEWLRNDLREWAEDLLDEGRLKQDGYLDAASVRAVWTEHLAGKANHAQRLWCALMFQAWKRRWM